MADKDVYFNVSAKTLSDWFSFNPTVPIKVPAHGNVKVTATVNPPSDSPNQVYTSTIYITPVLNATSQEGSATLSVFPAVSLEASINVTGEQLLAGNVQSIVAYDN